MFLTCCKIRKIFYSAGLVICLLVLPSCSNVRYVSNEEIFEPSNTSLQPDIDSSNLRKLNEYGSVAFTNDTVTDNDDTIFEFKRNNSRYVAETLFHEDEEQRSFFNFGLDHRTKAIGFGLRLEY